MGETVIIAGRYDFNGGEAYIREHYSKLLEEVEESIAAIDKESCKTKTSTEKSMPGKALYSPARLNQAFKDVLFSQGWVNHREKCDYPTKYYTDNYNPKPLKPGAFREIDFVKDKLGVEVQFGKYSFMVL